MFGDIPLFADAEDVGAEPIDEELDRKKKRKADKKKRKATEIDYDALASAGYSATEALSESGTAKRLEEERVSRLTAEREKEQAQANSAAAAVAAVKDEQRKAAERATVAKAAEKEEEMGWIAKERLKAKDKGGKMTFNDKEKRSRTKRGDDNYVEQEKRILRQNTDGFSFGY